MRAFTTGETVQSPCIDWLSTDAGVWLTCFTAKSLSYWGTTGSRAASSNSLRPIEAIGDASTECEIELYN